MSKAAAQRDLRRRRREQGLPSDDPRHGTANGYDGWGCRCQPCTLAKNTAETSRPVYRHGTTNGYRRGCRCADSTAASSRYKKTSRAAARGLAMLAALLLLVGCRSAPAAVSVPRPAVTAFALASDHGPLLVEYPWCDDPAGHSVMGWPCRWDRTASPATGWDRQVPNIAIFVRAVDGCPVAVDTGGRAWACYWRPQDQAGATS